jgi:acetylglutamate kinase
LDAFVAVIVHGGDELVEEWRRRRNVEVVVECH